jgi:hypothetical protein
MRRMAHRYHGSNVLRAEAFECFEGWCWCRYILHDELVPTFLFGEEDHISVEGFTTSTCVAGLGCIASRHYLVRYEPRPRRRKILLGLRPCSISGTHQFFFGGGR